MKESGLSIHFQDDNERKRNKNQNPTEKEETKPEKKEEIKPVKIEKNKKNNQLYRYEMTLIIVITFELIAVFLFLPVILMGR